MPHPRDGLAKAFELGLHLAVAVALADDLAFLVGLFPPGQGELHLDLVSGGYDDLGGDQRQALFLDLAQQTLYLPPVEQQFALPQRLMVETVGRRIGADVAAYQKHLSVTDLGVAFLEADPPLPDRLDFTPLQGDSRFETLQELVIEIGFFIFGDDSHPAALHD